MSEPKQDAARGPLGRWTRRGVLATTGLVGGGLALGITLAPNRLAMRSPQSTTGDEILLNTWVKLTPDNRLTVLIPHSEMGQGAGTGLAQMLAEELDADWSQVAIEDAPVAPAYVNSDLGRGYIIGEGASIPGFMYPLLDFAFLQIAKERVGQLTGGSTAIRLTGYHGMRRAGAAARAMLLAAAADLWQVAPATLSTRDSYVHHAASGRSIAYGELASAAARYTPNLKPDLKAPRDYRLVGQPVARLDLPSKVDGSATFGIDVDVEGMRYAAIALPAVRDARATIVNDAEARRRDGVDAVLNLDDVVAVIADSYWTAQQALETIELRWDGGQDTLSSATVRATHERDLGSGKTESMVKQGNAVATIDAAATQLRANYAVPYLAHATMEPLNCTVHARADGADLWVGHQNFMRARDAVARVLELAPERIRVHKQLLGGGFGRRGETDFVTIAARIAARVDTPIKVIWSRENDMTHDTYRPAVRATLRGAVADRRLLAFHHRYIDANSGMPDSEAPYALPYDVKHVDIARIRCPSPIPVGTWRSVDFTQHGFFNESFVDELAHAAGVDPLEFRLAHLSDPRTKAVLERVAEASKWGDGTGAAGRARGVAVVKSFDTIVAQVVEVSIEGEREPGVRVHRVTSAVDCGLVVNPDSASAQIHGSVIFALSAALFGEITLDGGRVQQRNFPDYRLLTLANAPSQSVHFVDSDAAPGGLGEPGVPAVAPALTNAIFAATGVRLRELPVAKQRLIT